MTIDEAIEEYGNEWAAMGRRSIAWKAFAKQVSARWGVLLVNEAVTAANVSDWVNDCRARGNKPATIREKLHFARALCRLAEESGHQAHFPRRLLKFKVHNSRTRVLSPDELLRLERVMLPEDWKVCVFAAKTGLRSQEMFDLRVSNCIFGERPTMFIERTKTGKTRRVPLVGEALKIAREARDEGREFVVQIWFNGPRRAEAWKDEVFRRCLRLAGIKDFRFHDWRHQCATTMIENGANHVAVSQVMGWESPNYLNRYANLRREALIKAALLA